MNWVRITAAENIPPREGRAVQVGSLQLAIFNTGEGFLAVEARWPMASSAGPQSRVRCITGGSASKAAPCSARAIRERRELPRSRLKLSTAS
jgi:nitrite reductase/ring-hydroxylating ferredoxin subunit